MYVRLAFAVAAHLEPEILLVDEVLAVGDAAFQRKCLGKMGEVAERRAHGPVRQPQHGDRADALFARDPARERWGDGGRAGKRGGERNYLAGLRRYIFGDSRPQSGPTR